MIIEQIPYVIFIIITQKRWHFIRPSKKEFQSHSIKLIFIEYNERERGKKIIVDLIDNPAQVLLTKDTCNVLVH